jgi:pseudouridine synthase
VKINGQLAAIGESADPMKDKITIKGHLINVAEKKIYVKLNKPLDYTCTNRKFPGEKNIFDLVKIPARLYAVGRLDKNSRGLVLLTNDGELTQRLAHPRYEHGKKYEVKVSGEIKNGKLIADRLMKGVDIGEGDDIAHAQEAQYLQNNFFIITLSEGKKRQIRRMFDVFDLRVVDLNRTALAGLELGDLALGKWEYLNPEEIKELKK